MPLIFIKWSGTTLCLIGILLTSLNIYPINVVFGLVGSGFWTLAGIYQRDMPLFLVEAVAALFYLMGLAVWMY
jgi:hypothetical protein